MFSFEEVYQLAIRTSHNIVEDIRFKRVLNLEPTLDCANKICDYLNSFSNIFASLNHVRDNYPYLYSHPVNVSFISHKIGEWLNLSRMELYNLTISAFLHDVGKAKIKDSLLNKTEKLSTEEQETVRTHSMISYQLLDKLNALNPEVLIGILHHHERIDGSGYPFGLKGDQISLFGRIIAVADIFDAVTATKAYQTKSSAFRAVEEIGALAFETLDPFICQVFINHSIDFYYKSKVKLSNEQIGEVIYINPEEKTRPLIRCKDEFLNLSKERSLIIVDVL